MLLKKLLKKLSVKSLIFISLYYKKNVVTGANKRFDSIINSILENSNEEEVNDIWVVCRKGEYENHNVNIIEIPKFNLFSRYFDYLFLSFYSIIFIFKKSFVITDFNPIVLPQLFSTRQYQLVHDVRVSDGYSRWSNLNQFFIKFFWKRCKNFIVVSEFTKSRLIEHYDVIPDNIIISYNGVNELEFCNKKTIKDIDLLYIATFEERKNHILLIRALDKIKCKLNVVFIGRDLGLKSEIEIAASELHHNISFIDSCSSSELDDYYARTKVFISPSLYEGFGMPILEAYVHGCFVTCSDIAVFREILNENAVYFSPYQIDDIKDAITKTLMKVDNKNDDSSMLYVKRIREKFLWSNITKKLLADIKNND